MADMGSIDVVLDFLRKNRFTGAEAALRSELRHHPDLNAFLQKLSLEEKDSGRIIKEEKRDREIVESPGPSSLNISEVSKELIVKEIEYGTGRNGSESKWRKASSAGERDKPGETCITNDKSFTFSGAGEETVLELETWNSIPNNGACDSYRNDGHGSKVSLTNLSRYHSSEAHDTGTGDPNSSEEIVYSGEKRNWLGNSSKGNLDRRNERGSIVQAKEPEKQLRTSKACLKEKFTDNNTWLRSDEPTTSSLETWNDCSVKTVFPFSKGNASTNFETACAFDKKEGKLRTNTDDIRAMIKGQVDEIGRALYFGKSQDEIEQKNLGNLAAPLGSDIPKEILPKLPPVKLKSEDKSLVVSWEEKYDRDGPGMKLDNGDNSFHIGSYLDVPIGQEINSSG